MPRVIAKPGDVFKIPLKEDRFAYAQWLADGTARYFLVAERKELDLQEVLALPVAFRVLTYRDTPNKYNWVKLGKASIPDEYIESQSYAKKDAISGELSIYHEGQERRATLEELAGLETAAVWAHPHIVERIEAQICGAESVFLKSISVA